jgi:hypothetical protein
MALPPPPSVSPFRTDLLAGQVREVPVQKCALATGYPLAPVVLKWTFTWSEGNNTVPSSGNSVILPLIEFAGLQVALVTGGSSGIGLEIVRQLGKCSYAAKSGRPFFLLHA